MDFQVNNETYYLGLADDDRQWIVFVETPTGTRRIPVYEDGPMSDDMPADDMTVVVEDKNKRKIVN